MSDQPSIEQLYKMLGEIQYFIEVNESSLKQLYQQKDEVVRKIMTYEQPQQND